MNKYRVQYNLNGKKMIVGYNSAKAARCAAQAFQEIFGGKATTKYLGTI